MTEWLQIRSLTRPGFSDNAARPIVPYRWRDGGSAARRNACAVGQPILWSSSGRNGCSIVIIWQSSSAETCRALAATGARSLIVAGGVGANRRLRAQLDEATRRIGARVYFPRPEFCTDNGAMIALAGALRLAAGQLESPAIKVMPRWDLESLTEV